MLFLYGLIVLASLINRYTGWPIRIIVITCILIFSCLWTNQPGILRFLLVIAQPEERLYLFGKT